MAEGSFDIQHEGEASDTLVVGISEIGIAGLTAVDYLVERLELQKCGHITTEELPSITPFENGTPRHHTRFFTDEDVDFTVLTGELFIPSGVSRSFSDSVADWTVENSVDEVVFLSGIPIPHGPEQHEVFYVGTDDYRNRRFLGELEPMGGGFLEGVHADLVARGIDSPLAVGVLTTPVHPPAQDVDAALRLLRAFKTVYDVDVDTGPLEEYASELKQHYEQLAERMSEVEEARQRPFDRTYM